MREKAFTLIELLVVISIVALLSSVVLASLNSAREKGRIGSARYFATQVDHITGDSAVGMWDFDDCPTGATEDRSGLNRVATLQVGAVSSTDTPSGKGCSISLDGTDDYVQTSLLTAADTSNPITYSIWFKTTRTGATPDPIVGHMVDGRIDIWRDGNVLRCRGFNAADNSAFGTSVINDGKWHLGVCVFDSTGIKAYVDGRLEGTNSNPTSSGLNLTHIGKTGSGITSGVFGGLVDNFHVFTKSLTASEVDRLYASEAPRFKVADK